MLADGAARAGGCPRGEAGSTAGHRVGEAGLRETESTAVSRTTASTGVHHIPSTLTAPWAVLAGGG